MRFKLSEAGKPVLLALLLAGGLCAAPAKAVLITSWEYEVGSGFFDYNPVQGPGNTYGVVGSDIGTLGLPTVLSWGLPSSVSGSNPLGLQSSLTVTDPIIGPPPALLTNQDLVDGATLTHNNFTIQQTGDALTDTSLATRLLLTPLLPPGATLPPLAAEFDILFRETANAGPCATGDVPCPDIFVLVNPENLVTSFVLDDFRYTVTLLLDGLDSLSGAACQAAGAGSECVGLVTAENQANSFQARFGITAVPLLIPEPGLIALLGALFLGLGIIRRRAG
ncbi:MAG: THxN family PEP-CTERM protein [Burkholderiales bacterium]|nr:THxN family PEP-CTERM protein [Burkholderiales bacterium]